MNVAAGNHSRADKDLQAAREVRDRFLHKYPEFLTEDPENEGAVFDQMLPMWVTQFSGILTRGRKVR